MGKMMFPIKALVGAYSVAKGVIMTAVVAALASSEPFWHQLVLVLVSAGLSAVGMILAALIGATRVEQKVEETHQALADVAGAVGAIRRRDDPPPK